MWFKHRAWIWIAWLIALVNLVGVPLALVPGEILHATLHAVGAVVFGFVGWRLLVRRRTRAMNEFMERDVERV